MEDVIAVAETVGMNEYHEPGALFFRELQVMHLLRCLKRRTFDDNTRTRLRRHVLLESGTGVGKTSIVNRFMELTGAVDIVNHELGTKRTKPVTCEAGGEGLSWERQRGSCNEKGHLVYPLYKDLDYMIAGEFKAVVGSNPAKMKERVNDLCRILEEGRVTVSLIKMANANEQRREEFMEEAALHGIRYNPGYCMMAYECDFSLIAATRPLGKADDIDYLTDSGLLGRFARVRYDPAESAKRKFRRNQFGVEDAKLAPLLTAFNAKAYRITVGRVNYPSAAMVDEVMGHLHSFYEKICDYSGLSIDEVANGRDVTDIAQLITAHAAARAFAAAIAAGKDTVDSIEYTAADVEWAKAYKTPALTVIYEAAMAKARNAPQVKQLREQLVAVARTHKDDVEVPIITSGELLMGLCGLEASGPKMKRTAAYERIREMKDLELIRPIGVARYLIVDDQVLDAIGWVAPQFPHVEPNDDAESVEVDV